VHPTTTRKEIKMLEIVENGYCKTENGLLGYVWSVQNGVASVSLLNRIGNVVPVTTKDIPVANLRRFYIPVWYENFVQGVQDYAFGPVDWYGDRPHTSIFAKLAGWFSLYLPYQRLLNIKYV